MVMAPLYVPAVSPAGAVLTVRDAGVAPLAGVTLSQLSDAEAVKLSAVPALVTEAVWAAGVAPRSDT